jgi:hypothetical protein
MRERDSSLSLGMKGMKNTDMRERDPSLSLSEPPSLPILQKPRVIPNEAQRNEESQQGKTNFVKTKCQSKLTEQYK